MPTKVTRETALLIGAGSVAVAGGAYLGVAYYKKTWPFACAENTESKSKTVDDDAAEQTLSATVEKKHVEYLKEMANKYTSGDESRATRVLVGYAMGSDDEASIFEVVRCNACDGKDKIAQDITMSSKHAAYLKEMATKHSLKTGTDKALRIILEYAMTDGKEEDIFTSERVASS